MGDPSQLEVIDDLVRRRIEEILPAKIEEKLKEIQANKTPSLSIIATKGTLDWAYPPYILASTASALGWDVSIFFTFYGLNLVRKDVSNLKISPLGNPGMPMKMPFGPDWFKGINWNIPNVVQASIPGFESMATMLMEQTIANTGVPGIEELRSACIEADVKFIACQMTVDLCGCSDDGLIDGMDYAGAATFLPVAKDSDVCLFI